MARKKICNVCGKPLHITDACANYSIQTQIGYGSAHDGSVLNLRFCSDCLDKFIASCKVSPVIEKTEETDAELTAAAAEFNEIFEQFETEV